MAQQDTSTEIWYSVNYTKNGQADITEGHKYELTVSGEGHTQTYIGVAQLPPFTDITHVDLYSEGYENPTFSVYPSEIYYIAYDNTRPPTATFSLKDLGLDSSTLPPTEV